jgi:hypothetical protein
LALSTEAQALISDIGCFSGDRMPIRAWKELRPRLEAALATPCQAFEGGTLVPVPDLPAAPTEEMIEAVRSLVMGCIEMHPRSIEAVREHVLRSGDSIEAWPGWAKTQTGHLTKGGIAELIWRVMAAAR